MPPTPAEVAAAADRLRRLAAGEPFAAVYAPAAAYQEAGMTGLDRRTLADVYLAEHPVAVPVGTPEEIQAACDRTNRVLCDDESRESVYGGDWKPKAKADFDLVARHWARQRLLADPVYQQGYDDGLLAALGVPGVQGGGS